MVGMAEATSRRVVNDEGEGDPDRLAGWLAEMAWFGLRGVRADDARTVPLRALLVSRQSPGRGSRLVDPEPHR
jgi:hypothetical protein